MGRARAGASRTASLQIGLKTIAPSRTERAFLADVLASLGSRPRSIPSKYLYDERGSDLFEQICELDEYYPTRTESAILLAHVDAILERVGARCMLVEYGSGSSTKTRILLDRARDLAAYVPIDISSELLLESARSLRQRYPGLTVEPVAADYTENYELPKLDPSEARRVVWFPGSTIGNFNPGEAHDFLQHIAQVAGPGGGLLIGVDLHKDTPTLEAAYDDARGVSAEFALNVLERMNRELGADFDLQRFAYHAHYDATQCRIEMAIVSLTAQHVRVGAEVFELAEGERIRTEYSYKYSVEAFKRLASGAGLQSEQVWIDAADLFSVHYLTVA